MALPRDWSALRGRDVYLAENGFTVAGYDEPWTPASFFAIDFAVPNTRPHARAIRLHDLHHVVTGFGTDLAGEAEISIWELRASLRGLDLYVRSIILLGAFMGLYVAPLRALRAWRAAKGARSLWSLGVPYEELLQMSVADLRALTGVPPEGLMKTGQGLHKNAPKHPALPVMSPR